MKDRITFKNDWKKQVPSSFDTSGIYCMKINNYIVYIGESCQVRERIVEHLWAIVSAKEGQKDNKYWHLKKAKERGYKIIFTLLEDCKKCSEEERMQKENEWITYFNPPLNTKYTHGMHLNEFYENVI